MESAFLWGGIGVLLLFILIGFVAGLIRGLKRSALHILFFVVSFVVAFFITKPITSALLGISITIDGTATTLGDIVFTMINKSFDLSQYQAAGDFAKTLPLSLASPIMFILISLIVYFLFDIIYLIVARVSFGKKKQDFAQRKPLRWYGSAVGAVEGFLFMFLLFAPLASLTSTYTQLASGEAAQNATTTAYVAAQQEDSSSDLPQISDLIADNVPSLVDDIIKAFNGSVVGQVAGAGGLNDALFDYLSASKVNGESINLRKDILTLADTYDEFVIAYNAAREGKIDQIELTALKTNLEKFLNEGLFSGVVAPTVKDLVVNINLDNPPEFIASNEFLMDLVTELKTGFSSSDFEAKTYLKDDLLKIVDVADIVLSSNLYNDFQNLDTSNMEAILKKVSEKSEDIKTIVDEVFTLHILNYGINAVGNFASDKISEYFDNADIKLNLSAQDKTALISQTLDALQSALEINDKLPISSLFDGDPLAALADITDLDQILLQVGETLDEIRNLDILVFPAQAGGETKYVFDEILTHFHISLLGDTVKDTTIGTNGKIDSYQALCKHLLKPVQLVEKMDILSIINNAKVEDILDKLLNEMNGTQQNSKLLAQLLLPFYELDEASINTEEPDSTIRKKVFDEIVTQLDENVNEISFEDATTVNTYENWESELSKMGETLLLLDDKNFKIEAQGKEYTYIRYMLSENGELRTLVDKIVQDGRLKNILKSLFNCNTFDPLVDEIFAELDKALAELTGVKQGVVTTDYSRLDEAQEDEIEAVAEVFEKMLSFANNDANQDLNNVSFTEIGELLDSIKTNAYNSGTKDGVFKAAFENLIWYLTGQDISGGHTYQNVTSSKPFSESNTFDKYLKNGQGTIDYYTVNFQQEFAELEDVKNFVQALKDQNVTNFVIDKDPSRIQESVNTLIANFNSVLGQHSTTEQEKITVLTNARRFIDAADDEGEILQDASDPTVKPVLSAAIEATYPDSVDLQNAVKKLLGIED